MALQKAIELPNGLSAPDAYWRIEQYTGDRHRLTITVQAYKDAAAAVVDPDTKETAKAPMTSVTFGLPTPNTSSNMFELAYDFLKSQEFFSDAIDV